MKKLIALFAVAGLLNDPAEVTAQEAGVDKSFYKTPYKSRNIGSFDKGSGLLSFGYGFPNLSGTGWGNWSGGSGRIGLGPVYVKYEQGIRDEIGIGGYVSGAFARVKDRWGGNEYVNRQTAIGFGVLGYYHFNKVIPVKNLDVYAGVGIGFRNVAYSYDDNYPWTPNSNDFSVLPIVKVGARYYFGPSFGVFAESGFDDMSSVNMGITLRF